MIKTINGLRIQVIESDKEVMASGNRVAPLRSSAVFCIRSCGIIIYDIIGTTSRSKYTSINRLTIVITARGICLIAFVS